MPTTLDRLASLRVSDIMTRQVVSVAAHQTMAEAAELFLRHKISGAPVVDEQGRCVGVLSAADFVWREREEAEVSAAVSTERRAETTKTEHPERLDDISYDLVTSHMSPAVQTVHAHTSLIEAARTLCAQHIHRAPVLDAEGKPQGIFTSLDVVAAVVKAAEEAAQKVQPRRPK
jgi:CBS domain-containing protein